LGGSGRGLILKYCHGLRLEDLKENHEKNLVRNLFPRSAVRFEVNQRILGKRKGKFKLIASKEKSFNIILSVT
jgi:hypothetical protein